MLAGVDPLAIASHQLRRQAHSSIDAMCSANTIIRRTTSAPCPYEVQASELADGECPHRLSEAGRHATGGPDAASSSASVWRTRAMALQQLLDQRRHDELVAAPYFDGFP